ncbi:ABC transporter ATP-binding protein [Agrobacterium tumefaciens]|uniref:Iron complex transport system ATP-binding protein n=1 Tax=Agrobacterium tumefaciens TaxID=358 RepID=A0A2L2LID3_AGRTU|nr:MULTISPECIES: ABC transporter ATP-binding protein [Agrobacterium]AVH44091.1 iron complex transport system ATP-binding protein [Agrobacterium tumefaciens]MDA5241190.1 ABC transporter ATP-binding protein [Agrobacterium sp. MAFF310724]MDA5249461.1 ABC transporter ATP-binding protein [Agrobacterium sp. MAFF210268]NSY98015.1 ABC transporter ATP-binding protein [Agrobacterium tumefaciens]NSZ03832.1 ABC transporter ATP-binding protein [Agrobacterium tumefaciens]
MTEDNQRPAKIAGKGIDIAYGQRRIIERLDLAIPERCFTALIGPNGSGKSTLLRTFAGLMKPSGGSILLDGKDLNGLSPRDVARKVGVLLQGPVAPEGLTVGDLVRQGRYPHRSLFSRWSAQDQEACDEALMLTGTTDLSDRALDSLSGGQRQRAWIAMTLAQQGEAILLDEPTTYLDLEHQVELMNLITTLVSRHGKTVVAVLHDINQAARYAQHIVILHDGRVTAAGTPDMVISSQTIADVFKVKTVVIRDPVAGTPLCIPL